MLYYGLSLLVFSLFVYLYYWNNRWIELHQGVLMYEPPFVLKLINLKYYGRQTSFVIFALVCAIFFMMVQGLGYMTSLFYGVCISLLFYYLFLTQIKERETKKIITQLPYVLDVICFNLKVGKSLPQSIDAAYEISSDPIKSILLQLVMGNKLGVPMENVLSYICNKYNIKEMIFFSILLNNSNISGGSVINSFVSLAQSIRSQYLLNKKIKKNTSDNRTNFLVFSILILVIVWLNYDNIIELQSIPYGDKAINIAIFCGVTCLALLKYVSKVE